MKKLVKSIEAEGGEGKPTQKNTPSHTKITIFLFVSH